jgi:UDP-N-acetylglucosamine 1-carboxyvinyltransferase
MNYSIVGGKKLSGSVQTNISKNASVALLAASLLNKGVTTLKRVPRIEEVRRLIEVMRSIGVTIEWNETTGDMVITPPERFDLEHIDRTAAGKTRSIFMFIAPLAHRLGSCLVPAPTGCNLGKRSLGSHIDALARLGIHISGDAATQSYKVEVGEMRAADIVMYEASDTGVENVLMAAALVPGETTIKFASANYMVQDLCVFLQSLGVRIDGIGTSTLVIHGVADIDMPVTGYPSEDPIETMFFISAAATTGSELTITRCPIDFVELELFTLGHMGLSYEIGKRYVAENGHTMLADVIVRPSTLVAPPEKVAPRPYPGINIDNLPFFVPIATQAKGETMLHDWVYDGRAQYYLALNELGADIRQLDPHRVVVQGPTKLHAADVEAPSALRPATIILVGMLAAEGESLLRNVYPINRGYENLHERLQKLGAQIQAIA